MSQITIGVLALQGDFELHRKALDDIDCPACEVRTPADLDRVTGLIIPGGESTTVGKLLISSGLDQAITSRFREGSLALFGTCMGVIVLAREIENRHKNQFTLGLLDITVSRNAYGRQVDSFETGIPINILSGNGTPFHAVFIRAPQIRAVSPHVETLAVCNGQPVLVRQDNILGACFHPEITHDTRIHAFFRKITEETANRMERFQAF
jgi:pyridoxal 5'-phosphate synthase pdxT subunit